MEKLCAEIAFTAGRPVLSVNGEPLSPQVYALSDIPASRSSSAQAQRNIRLFAGQGFRLIQVDACLYWGWHKHTNFEIAPIRAEVAGALEAAPQAAVLIRLHMNPPYWWMRDHPEELTVYGDTSYTDRGEYERLIRWDNDPSMRVSLASEVWKAEAGACLAELCRQLADTPEGARVVGIQVACGMYGEWHQWSYIRNEPDYSRPMQAFFRRYLRQKYQNDAALQSSWGDKTAELAQAMLSGVEERSHTSHGCFRDPVRDGRVIDSLHALQLSAPEAILHFCRIIKQSWPRPVIAGTFYGYFFNTCAERAAVGGHLELQELLRAEPLDYLSGPFPYMDNRRLSGIGLSRTLQESVRLHGKLWLSEMDQHPVGTESFVGGDPAARDETVALLRRNILEPVVHGMGYWYYDHRIVERDGSIYRKAGWWDAPELLEEIGALRQITDRYAAKPYLPVADVALIYDTEVYYRVTPNPLAAPAEEYGILQAIGHTGAAYDCIHLADIQAVDWTRYRCAVFVNTLYLPEETAAWIKEHVAAEGRHLIWLYAPGYADDRGLDVRNIERVADVRVRRIPTETDCTLFADGADACTCRVSRRFEPLFAADEPSADIIGRFPSGAPAAICKRLTNHTAWFFSLPLCSADVYRRIFRQAGVHIYGDGPETVMVGSGLLVVTSLSGGECRLTLRSGKTVCLHMAERSTAVLDAETGELLRR